MMRLIDVIRTRIRILMRTIARMLNILTRGKLHPDLVTTVGVVMHIPIALLIASRHMYWLAALLLLIFGLFDALDGELARLQKRASPKGMLLDASTDRMKEVLLYTGAAYALALSNHPATAAWAAAACGASLCVSYVKARGEVAVASLETQGKISHADSNSMFKDGILSFEVRMFVLIVGLLSGYLIFAVAFIAIFAAYTAFVRLARIMRKL